MTVCRECRESTSGSCWQHPRTYVMPTPDAPVYTQAAWDALVAERDNAVAKGQSRLRCWLFGHDWKRREWHVLGTCDRCGKKEAGS